LTECTLSIGNTPLAQARADEYMRNFQLNEMRDDSDARQVREPREAGDVRLQALQRRQRIRGQNRQDPVTGVRCRVGLRAAAPRSCYFSVESVFIAHTEFEVRTTNLYSLRDGAAARAAAARAPPRPRRRPLGYLVVAG
jgi:hypothetical protein